MLLSVAVSQDKLIFVNILLGYMFLLWLRLVCHWDLGALCVCVVRNIEYQYARDPVYPGGEYFELRGDPFLEYPGVIL